MFHRFKQPVAHIPLPEEFTYPFRYTPHPLCLIAAKEVQQYIKNVIKIRGFSNQEIEKTMLLLLEEVGELAKSIRKDATDMGIDKNKANHYDTIESEVADVFIVLCSVCNKLDIDLYKALKTKEKENIMRTWKKEK